MSFINESKAEPAAVLSKKDLCDEPDDYRWQVQKLDDLQPASIVSGTCPESCEQLKAWCQLVRKIVLLCSSGVGNSTLTNTLL